MPLGYIQGQKLDLELVRLTQHVATISHFDELAIPFRAVATDIETGDEIVLSSGNLARAIRASMAVPGAFDAVELDGRLLVDGLVTNNVPVDVARKMGADIAIVVNVGTPLKERSEITSALAIIEQYSNIVGQQNVSRHVSMLNFGTNRAGKNISSRCASGSWRAPRAKRSDGNRLRSRSADEGGSGSGQTELRVLIKRGSPCEKCVNRAASNGSTVDARGSGPAVDIQ